ncbi:MAG: nuclear transport factor 2 family protein [Sphingomonadaceae bacterium]|nr:nuclear transport factor 2 family protein [Sphingomonadaceae bacterium]
MTQRDATQKLEDLAAIQSLLNEYCLRLEVNDFDEWLEVFTPDGVYEVHGKTLNGREEIGELLSQAPHGMHMPGATRITLDTDTAETIQSYQFISNDPASSNTGWYYRTVVRTEDGWKISYCKVVFNRPAKK